MKRLLVLFGCAVFLVSVMANLYLLRLTKSKQTFPLIQQKISNPYLSPSIFTTKQNDILINFVPLRSSLIDYMKTIQEPIGMYFEYLPSDISIGIHEKDNYVLVSLLKVPVVMAIYRQIELGKITRETMLTIQKDDIDNRFGDLYKQPIGTEITIKQAVEKTLDDSDNTAKNLLGHVLTNDDILDVFDSLDIPKDTDGTTPVVSPKNYSSILRSLYLSSYLTKEDSNEILGILTKSHFNDKIAAPIPNSIPVAHKIGVHDIANDNEPPVYTDCGIIYVPKRPYILCVMTKAEDDKATAYMQKISKIIYDYVRSANE